MIAVDSDIEPYVYACCRFLYRPGQGLGAGSGIRGCFRIRALNTYIYGEMEEDRVFDCNCLSCRN